MAVGERALLPAVKAASDDMLIIADGFSCHEQIRQATGKNARHIAEVAAEALDAGGGDEPSTNGRSLKKIPALVATGAVALAVVAGASQTYRRSR